MNISINDTITYTINSGISSSASFKIREHIANDKAEAQQLYIEAASWLIVDQQDKLDDTSEDWKIQPMGVVDPSLQQEWKQKRLWMMDPLDDALGDDAMPALCSSCNGIFWGDEMMSVAKTILRLRDKHDRSVVGMMGNIWDETERNVLKKLRANRICKKCYHVAVETQANAWQQDPYNSIEIPIIQPSLPLTPGNISISPSSSSNPFPNMSQTVIFSSGIPAAGEYNEFTASTPLDCISKIIIESNDDI